MQIFFQLKIKSCCQAFSHVQFFAIQQTEACQGSLSFTISWSLLRFMSIESVMLPKHLILCLPFSFYLLSFPVSGFSPKSQLFTSDGHSIGVSAPASVLPMNIQGGFPLGLTGLISLLSNGLSRVFSNTTVQKHRSLEPNLLQGPNLTSLCDYWKNHSFDQMDHCRQSNVSAF